MRAKRICAWCGKSIGWGKTTDGSPTHGICDKCLENQIAADDKIEKELKGGQSIGKKRSKRNGRD